MERYTPVLLQGNSQSGFVLHLKLFLHILGASMRLAAPGEQEWSPIYLCPMAQHKVWHAIGAQLMFVDWMDRCVGE